MQKRFYLSALFFLIVPIVSSAESVSVSSVPFESVDYFRDQRGSIVFYGVRLKKVWKVLASVDSVEVELSENQAVYTTLNLVNAQEEYGSIDWMKAEKVVVVVRAQADLVLWQKFLLSVKEKKELERKRLAEPKRVLPPTVK